MRDSVEDISPKVEIVALVDDVTIRIERKLGAPVSGVGGYFLKDMVMIQSIRMKLALLGDGDDFHLQAFTATCQARAQSGKFSNALDALDRILENDIRVVIREDMRPIWFAVWVIGL